MVVLIMNNNSDMFEMSNDDILQILNESTINDKKPNQERLEFQRLCTYINDEIMHYSKGEPLPEQFVNSIRNAVSVLKLQSSGFTCIDFLMLLEKQKEKIEYCCSNMSFKSELHRLNTILKICKNSYIDSLIYREERQAAATQQRYIIDCCQSDKGLKQKLKEKCGNDEHKCNVVIASLIQAWCNNQIKIVGIE